MKAVFLAVLGACATDDLAFDPARCDAPRTYQIDQVKLPRNSSDLTALALDLDGNGLRDNALGQTSATLIRMFEQVPLDLDARAAEHLATDTAWRISIADCGGATRALAIGHDLLDTEGALVDGRIEATGSSGFVPLVALFDGTGDASSLMVPAEQTAVSATEDGDELTATIGFAISGELASPLVIHGMTPFLDQHLDLGRAELDANGDGAITEAEVASNPFAHSLLGTDLVVDQIEAISLGIRIHGRRQ